MAGAGDWVLGAVSSIALSPTGTSSFPDGGGHWWVYLQYALGLRDLGFRVVWVERCSETSHLDRARQILRRFGFADDDVLLYEEVGDRSSGGEDRVKWLTAGRRAAERSIASCEALLNFDYDAPASVVATARRSALVDIDPGLMQTWWAKGEISPPPHDRWFTTGETVGTTAARFPDCGVDWIRIRPCVHLPSWPVVPGPGNDRFTTVTSWWGTEWLALGDGAVLDNNKRAAFLAYVELPKHTDAQLELTAYFGDTSDLTAGDVDDDVNPSTVGDDADDVAALLANGWSLRRSRTVAADPHRYRHYIQRSSGEFSCVKPSCRLFANAWVSDRTLCYLASGRPVVTEHTGASDVLDGGMGLVRFASIAEAAEGLRRVRADYEEHRRAARQLAEEHFSATATVTRIVDTLTSDER